MALHKILENAWRFIVWKCRKRIVKCSVNVVWWYQVQIPENHFCKIHINTICKCKQNECKSMENKTGEIKGQSSKQNKKQV